MTVQIKQGKVRSKPSFLAPVVRSLPYATRVLLKSKQGDWIKVLYDSTEGWMHKSALTEKKIVLKAGNDVKKAASDDELVLAGKGFSEDVERSYRQQNPAVSFAEVDRMENYNIAAEKVSAFMREGGLGS